MTSPLERVKDVSSLAYLSDDSPAVVNTADLRALVRVAELAQQYNDALNAGESRDPLARDMVMDEMFESMEDALRAATGEG